MDPQDIQAASVGDSSSTATVVDDSEHRAYWEGFYHSRSSVAVPSSPSPFAQWVAQSEPPDVTLVDVGSGTGRDTLWFARQGCRCVGLDYAEAAVENAQRSALDARLSADFMRANLYDRGEILETGARIREQYAPELVYARFLVHAIGDDGRQNLWAFSTSVLGPGGRIYMEFRTEPTKHEFGEHYRHFVQPDTVVSELEALGATITHRREGHGLAVYKDEDPEVCRLVAQV